MRWDRWKRIVGPGIPDFGPCPQPPAPPPRFAAAVAIARRVCAAEKRHDLVTALESLRQADETVDRALPTNRPLPRSTRPGRSRIDPRLGRVATRVAAHRVEVRCWLPSDWARIVAYGFEGEALAGFARDGRAQLHTQYCDRLADFPRGRSFANVLDAFALNVVAHEAKHIASPNWSEAQVECFALQHVDRTAVLLGASPTLARRLARLEWTAVYPHDLPDYRSDECAPGRALDESPGDGIWP